MFYLSGFSRFTCPSTGPLLPRSVTAGDSFDAGLITGLLSGLTVERSLSLGCACGALSTQAIGGTSAQPTLAQALEAVESLTPAKDSR